MDVEEEEKAAQQPRKALLELPFQPLNSNNLPGYREARNFLLDVADLNILPTYAAVRRFQTFFEELEEDADQEVMKANFAACCGERLKACQEAKLVLNFQKYQKLYKNGVVHSTSLDYAETPTALCLGRVDADNWDTFTIVPNHVHYLLQGCYLDPIAEAKYPSLEQTPLEQRRRVFAERMRDLHYVPSKNEVLLGFCVPLLNARKTRMLQQDPELTDEELSLEEIICAEGFAYDFLCALYERVRQFVLRAPGGDTFRAWPQLDFSATFENSTHDTEIRTPDLEAPDTGLCYQFLCTFYCDPVEYLAYMTARKDHQYVTPNAPVARAERAQRDLFEPRVTRITIASFLKSEREPRNPATRRPRGRGGDDLDHDE